MTNGLESPALARRALREYRILTKILKLIREEIEDDAGGTPRSPTARELNLLLTHLEHHFKLEEDGGLFNDLRLKLPGEGDRIGDLEEEHAVLLADLRRLIKRLGESAGPPDETAMRDEVESFLRRLESHEIAENNLFQRAYNLDEAAHD